MVPFLWRAAWKVKGPSSSRSFSRTLSHCTTNRLPEQSRTQRRVKGNQELPNMTAFTEEPPLTVVRVPHCWVLGEAGVKVGHEGSDVLCGSQHSMSNLPHEDEPWEAGGRNTGTDVKSALRTIAVHVACLYLFTTNYVYYSFFQMRAVSLYFMYLNLKTFLFPTKICQQHRILKSGIEYLVRFVILFSFWSDAP